MNNKYKVIALIGPAGSGKDTILNRLINKSEKFNRIINCTTRPKRQNEVEGMNYYFLNPQDFAERLLSGEFIEATNFNNWFYGTSIRTLKDNKINIGVFNPSAIEILNEDSRINLTTYFIAANDKTRLLRQLNREEAPNVNEIIRRYQSDNIDFSSLDFPFIQLTNETKEDIDRAVKEILGRLD